LDLRKKELEQVVLLNRRGIIDLLPLWETSYGFEILSALCMGLTTNLKGIDRIRIELLNDDIDLQITNNPEMKVTPSQISEELQSFIRMVAYQCGM
jgi:hypothetical protein